jgi:multiple sugar transport system permease protein
MATGEATLTSVQARTKAGWRRRPGGAIEDVLTYGLLALLALLFAFPFFWTVSSSLKEPWEIFSFPPTLLPVVPQWQNYARVLEKVPFHLWVQNTLIVVILTTIGTLLTASLVAYSFARFEYRGRDLLFFVTLGTMMLPAQVTLIPQFVLFQKLGWVNTLNPLWVPAWFGGSAFSIFLLRQFILTLPRDLDEAALIDGAGYVRIYWSILMPLCAPALATLAVLTFIASWNDFVGPLIYLNSRETFTLAVGLNYFQSVPERGVPLQHLLMAASLMTILPCIVVFFLAQRYFTEGIVLSGIKG